MRSIVPSIFAAAVQLVAIAVAIAVAVDVAVAVDGKYITACGLMIASILPSYVFFVHSIVILCLSTFKRAL